MTATILKNKKGRNIQLFALSDEIFTICNELGVSFLGQGNKTFVQALATNYLKDAVFLNEQEAELYLGLAHFQFKDLVKRKKIPVYKHSAIYMFKKEELNYWNKHFRQSR